MFITHDLNEAMRLGDRIAMMRDGRIVQIGTPRRSCNDPANDYVAQFVQDVDRSRVLTASAVMEKPATTVGSRAGPRQALKTMREQQVGAAFVVDRERRLVGAVRDDAVAEAVRGNKETLDGLMNPSDLVTVGPDTIVADLLTPSAENQMPLAVVDDERRLLGAIPRVTLLAALGTGHGDSSHSDSSHGDGSHGDSGHSDGSHAAGNGATPDGAGDLAPTDAEEVPS